MQTKCFGAFWTSTYYKDTKGGRRWGHLWVYCRQHGRYEYLDGVHHQLIMLLGANLLSSRDYRYHAAYQEQCLARNVEVAN
jgi:hypothetical protein